MKQIIKFKLLRDLPMYPAGTIIFHEFEILPSRYLDRQGNRRTYSTDGEWYVMSGDLKTMATSFLEKLVDWCSTSQREDTKGWVEKI